MPRKHPWRKSFFINVPDYTTEVLKIRNLDKYVFLRILRLFQDIFSSKNFLRLPMDGIYLLY